MTLNNYIWMFLVFNPLKLRTSEQLSSYFMRRTMIKHNSCNKLLNKFQDDILCVLAIYPYIWNLLYKILHIDHDSQLSSSKPQYNSSRRNVQSFFDVYLYLQFNYSKTYACRLTEVITFALLIVVGDYSNIMKTTFYLSFNC